MANEESVVRPVRVDGFWVRFIEQRPILAAVLIGLLVSPIVMVSVTLIAFLTGLTQQIDVLNPIPIAVRAALTIFFYLTLRRHGWTRLIGFNGLSSWKQSWLIWLPATMVLVNLSNLIGNELRPNPDIPRILGGFVQGLSIALFEETTFRGLVLAILLNRFHANRRQIIGCVLFSSLLFGFYHLPTNPYWEMNLSQWIYAIFAGVAFAAVVLRTRSIWLCIAVHTLIIAASIATSALLTGEATLLGESGVIDDVGKAALIPVLITFPLFIYGLYLLRDIGPSSLGFAAGKTIATERSAAGA